MGNKRKQEEENELFYRCGDEIAGISMEIGMQDLKCPQLLYFATMFRL